MAVAYKIYLNTDRPRRHKYTMKSKIKISDNKEANVLMIIAPTEYSYIYIYIYLILTNKGIHIPEDTVLTMSNMSG
jgi:hypothetical protein